MWLQDIVGYIQIVFGQFNYLILIGALIVSTGVAWDLPLKQVLWGPVIASAFLCLGILGGLWIDGCATGSLLLHGNGGRIIAVAYGVFVATIVVILVKCLRILKNS